MRVDFGKFDNHIMAGSTKMKKGPVAVAVVVTLLLVGTVVKMLRTPGVAVQYVPYIPFSSLQTGRDHIDTVHKHQCLWCCGAENLCASVGLLADSLYTPAPYVTACQNSRTIFCFVFFVLKIEATRDMPALLRHSCGESSRRWPALEYKHRCKRAH